MKKNRSKKWPHKASAVEKKPAAPLSHSSIPSSILVRRKRPSPEESYTQRSLDSKEDNTFLRTAPPQRVNSAGRKSRRARRVTQAVAIHRIQRWFRCQRLRRRLGVHESFSASVLARKVLEDSLESIRVMQAKRTLKMFFNSGCSATRVGSRRSKCGSRVRAPSISYRAKKNNQGLTEVEEEALATIQAAFLAKISFNETLQREAKELRAAARVISRYWVKSKLYQHLRHLSLNRLTQRVLTQHETIERREILRLYYKALIEMHQNCYNAKIALKNDCGTRHVSLHYSLLLFSSVYSLKEIMDDVQKPHGTGPYHPYSVEKLPENFQTIRILERRFMFSKEERRILQDEGILDVNEPPDEVSSFFDPNFVFGCVLDYLRPGEFLDKLRFNHPSLRLGIRRTSSLVLDSNFQLLEENGIQSTDKGSLSLPSPWSLRRNGAALHALMCQLGYIQCTEVDGSFHPVESNTRKWAADPITTSEESAEKQQLYSNRVLVFSSLYRRSLPFSPNTTATPLVQDFLVSEHLHGTQKPTNSVLLDSGDPISISVLHPAVKENSRKELGNHERQNNGHAANTCASKYSVSQKVPKNLFQRYFSSTRVLGDTWKTFLERANFQDFSAKNTTWNGHQSTVGKVGGRAPFSSATSDSTLSLGKGVSKPRHSLSEFIPSKEQKETLLPDVHFRAMKTSCIQESSTRKYKHLTSLFGSPEENAEEKGLGYFLHQATKGGHSRSFGAGYSQNNLELGEKKAHSTQISVGLKADESEEEYPEGTACTLREGQSKRTVRFCSFADKKVELNFNFSVEVERLVIQENLGRQDFYRRFMLIFESIQKLCQVEAQRKESILRKFLQRDN